MNYKKISLKILVSTLTIVFVSCRTPSPMEGENEITDLKGSFGNIIPKPVSAVPSGKWFIFNESRNIYVNPTNTETDFIAQYLREKLITAAGFNIFILPGSQNREDGILLTINNEQSLGEEGYKLTILEEQIIISSYKPAGLFRGIQTLRQLFSPLIDGKNPQQGDWLIPTGEITDYPRFEWRGVMLDVARHFFKPDVVKSYVDLAAYYKINRFHLHLSDDQGWRIQINSWPNLAVYGGSTQVGGGQGGYYTQSEYSDIVDYAANRYITIVPEIDMPGHTNAALSSYPELNKDGIAPPLYTGIEVGLSALAVDKPITYKFIDDVVRELSAITPSPYIHIGGDEAPLVDSINYIKFIDSVQNIVNNYGKQMVGWNEILQCNLFPGSISQYWAGHVTLGSNNQNAKIIMSPAAKAYLDMKYNPSTPLGLFWAGYIEVMDAYNWEPVNYINGITENHIIGVEAPLWSETLVTLKDIEYMAFPRLPGYAEIGWSSVNGRNWDEYKERLAHHGLRWQAMEINFYQSPQVPWIQF